MYVICETRRSETLVWECPGATPDEVAKTVVLWRSWGIICRPSIR
jgi:hypothetical protein